MTRDRLHDNADAAIGLFDHSDANLLQHNELTRNGPQGVENLFSDQTVISHNRITRNGSGVILEASDGLRITHNTILHGDVSACDGCGIAVQIYGNHNLVAHNTLSDSPRYGIEVDDFQDPGHSPASDNVVVRNLVRDAGVGIAIGPEAGGVVLRTEILRNDVRGSRGDGIDLTGPSTGQETSLLAGNVAASNGGYGIEAVPGTHDSGGNRAFGNGNQPQCLNIVCAGTFRSGRSLP